MPKVTVFRTQGWASANCAFRACIIDEATGAPIVPATVSAIAWTVRQSVGPSAGSTTGSGSLSPVASYLFGSLSTVGWRQDTTGWNFRALLPASAFSAPGEYVVDFAFTLADGTTFPVKILHSVISRL